jgi:hypothetical protein
MSGSRVALQALLEALVPDEKVYFQPPANVEMQYPCITYERDYARTEFADNAPYRHTKRYQVTVIDRSPDSEIPDMVARLPLCSYQRHYTADNLHHDVFDLYF